MLAIGCVDAATVPHPGKRLPLLENPVGVAPRHEHDDIIVPGIAFEGGYLRL
jgi:hypothetical protein